MAADVPVFFLSLQFEASPCSRYTRPFSVLIIYPESHSYLKFVSLGLHGTVYMDRLSDAGAAMKVKLVHWVLGLSLKKIRCLLVSLIDCSGHVALM